MSLQQSIHKACAGRIVKDGLVQAMEVASWVLEEEKRNLQYSLVGFLKPFLGGESRVELWLHDCLGKMLVRLKLIDIDIVFMRFLSEEEVMELLWCVESVSPSLPSTPFLAVDK